ncbi:hypothetical protein CNMCM7691_001377 [Aspergillus felis]|uniref:Uncharacterized protein n=1 Tax=Aspergillus felis TaxID=1287682 RepID=A0A8H6QYX4_9EURO|nr:hypothetical protein CNMCM7691_001377 [Aspergillus felis]
MAHVARASFEQQSDRDQNGSGSSPLSDWTSDVGLGARASRDHGSESPDENSCLSLPVHAMTEDDGMVCEHNLPDVNIQNTDYAESSTLPAPPSGGYSSVPVSHEDLEHPENFNSTLYKKQRNGCCNVAIINDGWTYEVLTITLSIGCIAAIATILATMDGKSLSQWTMPIQPNALISVFAVVAKASLLYSVAQCIGQLKWLYFRSGVHPMIDIQRFDDASRGPWGSLIFLWKFRLTALTSSGACFITIAALAIDPFTQQVLEFPFRLVSNGQGSAYTQRSIGYKSDLKYTGTPQKINSAFQAAMALGLFGQSTGPPFVCPTGNCTYPDVSTLGFAGSCRDVTAESSVSCPNATTKINVNTNCTITTPSGDILTVRHGIHGDDMANVTWGTLLTSVPRNYAGGYQPALSTMFEFSLWNSSGRPGEVNGSTAFECTIELAERTYSNFSVTQGQRTIPSTFTTRLEALTANVTAQKFRFRPKVAIGNNSSSSPQDSTNYTLGYKDATLISITLQSIFITNLYPQGYGSQVGEPGVPSTGFDFSNILYTSQNLSELVDEMTKQMTEYMRNLNSTDVLAVPGESFQHETYIHVHWQWFSLPATLVVGAAIILQTTILINRWHGVRAWKSSVLPFLLHPLSGVEPRELGGMEKLTDIETQAQNMDINLGASPEGHLRFLVS